MAKLQLNKSSLVRETSRLRSYERALPSLDLKRRQLVAERMAARAAADGAKNAIADLRTDVARVLPMLANHDVELSGLARVESLSLETENVVGTLLPTVERVEIVTRAFEGLATPHWVDRAAELLREMLELKIQAQVAQRRLDLLEQALGKVTQRVNLFEKVLIPRGKANIKRIKIHLSDQAMSEVVRAKLAKTKRLKRQLHDRRGGAVA